MSDEPHAPSTMLMYYTDHNHQPAWLYRWGEYQSNIFLAGSVYTVWSGLWNRTANSLLGALALAQAKFEQTEANTTTVVKG